MARLEWIASEPPPQDHGVSGLQAKRGRVRGHVRATLVDHRHHAKGNPHPRHTQTVRAHLLVLQRAERVLLVGDVPHRQRQLRHPRPIETQSVPHRSCDPVPLGRGQVLRVRAHDLLRACVQGGGHSVEGLPALLSGRPRERARSGPGGPGDRLDRRPQWRSIFLVRHDLPASFVSTMRSGLMTTWLRSVPRASFTSSV